MSKQSIPKYLKNAKNKNTRKITFSKKTISFATSGQMSQSYVANNGLYALFRVFERFKVLVLE